MPPLALGSRAVAGLSLALIAAGAVAAPPGSEPWPLDGGAGPWTLARAATLALGLALGPFVPGLSLALLCGAPGPWPRLVARACGLGIGYLLLAGLGQALVFGSMRERSFLLVLLALPPLALLARGGPSLDARPWLGMAATVAALAALLWPKLALESLNGDGTEAYELARSLLDHPLPYWDLERAQEPGGFGTPAVNPFLTNSYLAAALMRLLGRGELAARLPLLPALVVGAALAVGLAGRPGRAGFAYVACVTGALLVWNAYFVGYEPFFTDLAEPAATDFLMIALWLAAFTEIAAGATAFGVAFLLLACGILYSAFLLSATALAALALWRSRRPLMAWLAAGAAALSLAILYGTASGQLGDWGTRLYAEYWIDLTDPRRRVPASGVLLPLLFASGGLPLLALYRFRRLTPPSCALVVTAAVYLAVVLAHSYKNLHYLAPLPFLLAAPALEASPLRARIAATLVALAGIALAWPGPQQAHRETAALGRASCVDGLGYEQASLAAGMLYDAFAKPGPDAPRFFVGKHTFVRYALELGGPDCALRLSHEARPGWLAVAGDGAALWVRDLDLYARWRFRIPPLPSSALFPRAARPPLPQAATEWPARIDLAGQPGLALLVEAPRPDRHRARLLVPLVRPGGVRLGAEAVPLSARVNGAEARVAPAEGAVVVESPAWRTGYNLLELDTAEVPLWLERP
jgi:hypothetical protein